MIEQPLWHDDFYYHSMLQKRLNTPICLDESIHNRRDALAAIEMESCKIINIKLGRVGGFSEAIAVTTRRRSAASRSGAAACWSPASAAPPISLSPRWRISLFPGMCPRLRATGPKTLSSRNHGDFSG